MAAELSAIYLQKNEWETAIMMEIGTVFEGRYRVEKIVGKGGMGTVYRAVDLTDGSCWAIKEQLMKPQYRQLLLTEAEILGKLHHPALPELRYRGIKGEYLYLVMEFIEGQTLEDVLKQMQAQGFLPSEEQVLDWFTQVAGVLVYLHGLETPVMYRDLKPANIMLEPSGRIRIIDFGIAQEYRDRDNGALADVAALTRGYAAPEQYNPKYMLNVRTDIYALGVTMHYLLTGKDPNKPPYHFRPARKLRPEASPAIEAVLKKCLQVNPDRRYASAEALLYELEHLPDLGRRIRNREMLGIGLAAAALVLILAGGIGVYQWNLAKRSSEITNYQQLIADAENAVDEDTAIARLNEALIMDEDNPEAYLVYAQILLKYEGKEAAVDYVNGTILPKFPEIYENEEFLELLDVLES